MSEVRYDTLAARVRLHLMEDPRVASEAEADAEINLMSQVELVEVLSHILTGMMTEIEDGVGVAFSEDQERRGLRP